MCKRIFLTLAVILCAGVLLFPLTAYAADEASLPAGIKAEADTDSDVSDVVEETQSGIPPYDGPMHITPDGTGTVIDNVFIEGNGLEFLTFSTEAGNVFYLVIDRLRTSNNVYFLNAVTESDLIALAEKNGNTSAGGSTSGIPSTSGNSGGTTNNQTEEPDEPEKPPVKSGSNNGMLIFMLIGIGAVGIAAYYFKIVRPKKQLRDDDDEGKDDYDDSEDNSDEYLGGEDDDSTDDEKE